MAHRSAPILSQPACSQMKTAFLLITLVLLLVSGCSSDSSKEVVIDGEKTVFPFPDSLSAAAITIDASNLTVELRLTNTVTNQVFVRVMSPLIIDDVQKTVTGGSIDPLPIGTYDMDINYIVDDPDFGDTTVLSFARRQFTVEEGLNVADLTDVFPNYLDQDLDGYSNLSELEAAVKSDPDYSFSIPVGGMEFGPPSKVKIRVSGAGDQGDFDTFWEARPGVGNYGVHMSNEPGADPFDAAVPMHHMAGINAEMAETGFGHALTHGVPWYVSVASQTQSSTDSVASTSFSSPGSAEVFVRSKADDPSAPKNIMIESGDGQNVISWDPPDNANSSTSYIVYWSSTNDVSQATSDTFQGEITGTSFVHTGAANGAMTYYVVTAVINNVEGPDSAAVGATPYGQMNAPQNVTADEEQVPGTIIVSWDPVWGAQSYTVYMASEGGVTVDRVERKFLDNAMIHPVSTATSFQHPNGLTVGQRYFFRVVAKDRNGRLSVLSDEASAQVHQ